jgi:hypothetical protein
VRPKKTTTGGKKPQPQPAPQKMNYEEEQLNEIEALKSIYFEHFNG